METANLIYNFCVLIITLVMFSMKLSGIRNEFLIMIITGLWRIMTLGCMSFSVIQIFKYFGII